MLVPLVSWITLSCGGAGTQAPDSLARAQAAARERGVPLLIDFYTDW